MTIIIGIRCPDGVVIGADSSGTEVAGQIRTIEQTVNKIDIIQGQIVLVGTGPVGLGQRFGQVVERYWASNSHHGKSYIDIGRELCIQCRADFISTGIGQGQYGALLAFPLDGVCHLCEFPYTDFQPEFKVQVGGTPHVTAGSGKLIADPFLGFLRDLFWSDRLPSLSEAVFATLWTLEHTIKFNPGGINGPARIAVLRKDAQTGVHMASELGKAEMAEHYANIECAYRALKEYRYSFAKPMEMQEPPTPPGK